MKWEEQHDSARWFKDLLMKEMQHSGKQAESNVPVWDLLLLNIQLSKKVADGTSLILIFF